MPRGFGTRSTDALNDELDAYWTKYGHYAANILDAITNPAARAATLRLVPIKGGER
jgi:hypothetical protein